jgi:hypothetical protein
MNDRTQLIAEFRAWRKAEGLDFNAAFVPKRFADLKDLEIGYWANEDEAKVAAKKEVAARPSPTPRDDTMWKHLGEFIAKEVFNPLAERIKKLEEARAIPKSVSSRLEAACGCRKCPTTQHDLAALNGAWLSRPGHGRMSSDERRVGTATRHHR